MTPRACFKMSGIGNTGSGLETEQERKQKNLCASNTNNRSSVRLDSKYKKVRYKYKVYHTRENKRSFTMSIQLSKPLVVPEYNNALVKLYVTHPVTRATVPVPSYTINVQSVLTALIPGRIARANACALN